MNVKILGCSGGIGGNRRTTSLLVDDDILIDAGTGVGDLSIESLIKINHVFITHSHLDHICCLPLLIDTVMGQRGSPVSVHATFETWTILKENIFNWKIWPDFTEIPSKKTPLLQFEPIYIGQAKVFNKREITALPANHTVPAVGFHLRGETGSLVFTGDTSTCEALWFEINAIQDLKCLIIETAFSNHEIQLARQSGHLCPSLLVKELASLKSLPEILITHFKPGKEELIISEIQAALGLVNIRPLSNGLLLAM